MLEKITRDNIQVGTKIWYVSIYQKQREETITKIGRKYAYFGNDDKKIVLETMQLEPDWQGLKRDSIWDSKEAYEVSLQQGEVIKKCIDELYLYGTQRATLTYDQAVKILAILEKE